MKKILITGSNGLLGQKLILKLAPDPNFEVLGISKGDNRIRSVIFRYMEVDVCNKEQVQSIFSVFKPDIVIHTAAMTNVDACETDKKGCLALNVQAVKNLLEAAEKCKSHFIHLSTDFIFDGLSGPYDETAIPNPLSFYGHSKLDSEDLVKGYPFSWAIARTVLVYGVVPDLSRTNIVLWAKGALEKGNPINVVNDHFRTPTLAEDLADGCILLAKGKHQGIYNISGPNFMSILELVERVAKFFNLPLELIKPISANTLNQAAIRPPRTGFIIDKAKNDLGFEPMEFEQGLALVAYQLGK
jgi:dTDP-4-dehydrorhamnose reductase